MGVRESANPALLVNGAAKADASAAVAPMAMGSYDAIRVYLWMGMTDTKTQGAREVIAQMQGMAQYLRQHDIPPSQVDADGKVLNADSPVGFSAAVIPYLHVLGLKAQEMTQSKRLKSHAGCQDRAVRAGGEVLRPEPGVVFDRVDGAEIPV